MWSVSQYELYRGERARPFLELLTRVPAIDVRRAADLGCGTGELTRLLCERWPEARVVGVDTSDAMLTSAAKHAIPGRLAFTPGDLATWRPDEPLDLAVTNAALHWVPDHERALSHLTSLLAPEGALAAQLPGNFDAPSHRILEEIAAEGPWADALRSSWQPNHAEALAWYVETLWRLGYEVDAWETTYAHVLQGDDPVLEWVKGTTLRPVLAALDDARREALLAAYGARLRDAYPRGERGTIFPFRRLFFVATRATKQ